MNSLLKYIPAILAVILMFGASSCSKDDDVRMPDDILGIWSPASNVYLEFGEENVVRNLQIEYQDGQNIGIWTNDVYYYEPGYNLVVYLSSDHDADVYKIVEMTSTELTWCWVKEIDATSAESIGEIIGDLIKEAQEGFKLNPDLYQTFNKISENQFLDILNSLNIMYPW